MVFLVMFFSVNTLFAQYYYLKINKTDGSSTTIAVSSIDSLTFFNLNCPATVDDADGNTYNTIVIGNQCWMKENLRVGMKIPDSYDQINELFDNIIEKYCYNNLDANCTLYGGLYQWAEAVNYTNGATNSSSLSASFSGNIQGICPVGWHLPTYTEIQALLSSALNSTNALKAIGQGFDLGAGTNTSGFSALMAGLRYPFGSFNNLYGSTFFWTTNETSSTEALYLGISGLDDTVRIVSANKASGFSVRCLKD